MSTTTITLRIFDDGMVSNYDYVESFLTDPASTSDWWGGCDTCDTTDYAVAVWASGTIQCSDCIRLIAEDIEVESV